MPDETVESTPQIEPNYAFYRTRREAIHAWATAGYPGEGPVHYHDGFYCSNDSCEHYDLSDGGMCNCAECDPDAHDNPWIPDGGCNCYECRETRDRFDYMHDSRTNFSRKDEDRRMHSTLKAIAAKFRGEGKYGVEMELEPTRGNAGAMEMHARDVCERIGWECGSDGSLDGDGIEVKTTPMDLLELPSKMENFWKGLESLVRRSKYCGTHIHTMRTKKNFSGVWRLRKMLGRNAHSLLLNDLYGREENEYCSRSEFSPIHWPRNGPHGHYDAISYSTFWPTWEFRMFAGCKTLLEAVAYPQCVDMMLYWQQGISLDDLMRPEKSLREFIKSKKRVYPALFKLCEDRGIFAKTTTKKQPLTHLGQIPNKTMKKKGPAVIYVPYHS